jgi:hypothetical protein
VIDPRTTDWIMTASGRKFWPLEPRVEDVLIEDIAHHLSNLCRFTGAARHFYSVAQHSVLVSRYLEAAVARRMAEQGAAPEDAPRRLAIAGLYGLGHDGSEAFLIDVPRPLKKSPAFEGYRAAERELQSVVYRAMGLCPDQEPAELKLVDRRMLRTEQRDLMPPAAEDEGREDVIPYAETVWPWSPVTAHLIFMNHFKALRHRAGMGPRA